METKFSEEVSQQCRMTREGGGERRETEGSRMDCGNTIAHHSTPVDMGSHACVSSGPAGGRVCVRAFFFFFSSLFPFFSFLRSPLSFSFVLISLLSLLSLASYPLTFLRSIPSQYGFPFAYNLALPPPPLTLHCVQISASLLNNCLLCIGTAAELKGYNMSEKPIESRDREMHRRGCLFQTNTSATL